VGGVGGVGWDAGFTYGLLDWAGWALGWGWVGGLDGVCVRVCVGGGGGGWKLRGVSFEANLATLWWSRRILSFVPVAFICIFLMVLVIDLRGDHVYPFSDYFSVDTVI
jgi:hypothetical protein